MKRWTTLRALKMDQKFLTKYGEQCIFLGKDLEDCTRRYVIGPNGFDSWHENVRAVIDVEDEAQVSP